MGARPRDIVVVGASAGGIEALRSVLGGLPRDLGATIFVTLHRTPSSQSILADVLGARSSLPVREPRGAERIKRNVVYLAPSNLHMRMTSDHVTLDHGAKQHHTRPAIDPMFESAAAAFGPRVIGILLSGNLSDGVRGLLAIKAEGGISIAQDPSEAEWPAMPANAIIYDHVDMVVRLKTLPATLTDLVGRSRRRREEA
jgi:two-component system chemotaxis response regulator CheB